MLLHSMFAAQDEHYVLFLKERGKTEGEEAADILNWDLSFTKSDCSLREQNGNLETETTKVMRGIKHI